MIGARSVYFFNVINSLQYSTSRVASGNKFDLVFTLVKKRKYKVFFLITGKIIIITNCARFFTKSILFFYCNILYSR